jgi:hypothetical protein
VEIPALSEAQAQTALAVLRAADLHGLQPKEYVPEGMAESGVLTPAQQTALADGLVRYAHDVHIGRMDPGEFPELWAVRPAPYDPSADLVKAMAEGRLQAWLDSLPPRYLRLRGAEARPRPLPRHRLPRAAGRPCPTASRLKLGDKDPRVAALRPGWRPRIALVRRRRRRLRQAAAGGGGACPAALRRAARRRGRQGAADLPQPADRPAHPADHRQHGALALAAVDHAGHPRAGELRRGDRHPVPRRQAG